MAISIAIAESGCHVISGSLSRFEALDKLKLDVSNETELNLDLSQLDTVDTAGLAWLLQAKYLLQGKNKTLLFKNPSDKLIKLASISGVNDILGI